MKRMETGTITYANRFNSRVSASSGSGSVSSTSTMTGWPNSLTQRLAETSG